MPHLEAGDIVIDGGNSYYVDDIRRAGELSAKGIHYVDVGTSGGVWGLERGYCMTRGGEKDVVGRLDPIFDMLAPGVGDIPRTPGRAESDGTAERGYSHCGPNGAGHFVKMVHNGIEYGIIAAYAEGLSAFVLRTFGKREQGIDAETTPLRNPEHYQYDIELPRGRRGVASRQRHLGLAVGPHGHGSARGPDRLEIRGQGVGLGRRPLWTIMAAIDEAVPTPVLTASLYERSVAR